MTGKNSTWTTTDTRTNENPHNMPNARERLTPEDDFAPSDLRAFDWKKNESDAYRLPPDR